MGKYAAANIRIESHYQFPEFQSEMAKPGSSADPGINAGEISPHSERSLSPSSSNQTGNASVSGSLNTEHEYSGLSFAKMLSSNKLATPTWPVRKSTTAVAPLVSQDKLIKNHKLSESDAEIEGYVPVPAFNQSFGDAIALALEKAALTNDDEDVKINGKKKKKNKQKKILFATSMGYSGN